MKVDPQHFSDIHAHSRTGRDILTSVEPGQPLKGSAGEVWYSVGIHPWSTSAPLSADVWRQLEESLADPRVIAVGECGLDKKRGGDATVQEEVFRRQAALAEKHHMPLIIHCVGRYGRLMELKRELAPSQLWIIHGFTGKAELARQLVAAGFAISLDPRSDSALAAIVPPDRLYKETDS